MWRIRARSGENGLAGSLRHILRSCRAENEIIWKGLELLGITCEDGLDTRRASASTKGDKISGEKGNWLPKCYVIRIRERRISGETDSPAVNQRRGNSDLGHLLMRNCRATRRPQIETYRTVRGRGRRKSIDSQWDTRSRQEQPSGLTTQRPSRERLDRADRVHIGAVVAN